MLNSLPICLVVGTVLGFLTGLGIGGGSLLMLWLTLVLGVSQAEARQINLLFFLPSALISCWMHKKQGTLNWKTSFPGMISGYIQELIGYQHFFLWIMLCTIPSFIAVKYIKI